MSMTGLAEKKREKIAERERVVFREVTERVAKEREKYPEDAEKWSVQPYELLLARNQAAAGKGDSPLGIYTESQIEITLRKLVEQDRLARFKGTFGGNVHYTTPEIATVVTVQREKAAKARADRQGRWLEVSRKIESFGLVPPDPYGGHGARRVTLETIELLVAGFQK